MWGGCYKNATDGAHITNTNLSLNDTYSIQNQVISGWWCVRELVGMRVRTSMKQD